MILKKESEEIDSKSTQAFSKKTENLFDNSKKADIIMKEENDKKAHLLELSEETKNIMNLIYNKKRKEKLNKINNKENDYSLLTMPDEQNSKNKKNYFKNKNINQLDSQSTTSKIDEPPKLSSKTLEIMKT